MKSNQEQLVELYNIFAQVQQVDEQIYYFIIEMQRKENISDCRGFLSKIDNQNNQMNYSIYRRRLIQETITLITLLTSSNKQKYNYSEEIYIDLKQNLINKISQDKKIIQFLKFLVFLTAIDDTLIQCGSNSLHLLVEMKVDLRNQNFENIKIQNTSLVGANFVKCNLSESQFKNVDISWMNLNRAILFNCKWNNLKIYGELNQLDSHSDCVNSVCFSPDGTVLVSGGSGELYDQSNDNSIRLWDVKTGQQKSKLDDHTSYVRQVCFSPDGNTLASGSSDNSISLWDVSTKKEIQTSDKRYKVILSQSQTQLFQKVILPVSTYITILLISQKAQFQAQGAIILNGEFLNQSGINFQIKRRLYFGQPNLMNQDYCQEYYMHYLNISQLNSIFFMGCKVQQGDLKMDIYIKKWLKKQCKDEYVFVMLF